MNDLVSGALVMGYALAGLFFLRFWKQSRDRLFAFFAAAFWILAVQRLALALFTPVVQGEASTEGHLTFYVLRLMAFVLILIAIVDKNRAVKKMSNSMEENE